MPEVLYPSITDPIALLARKAARKMVERVFNIRLGAFFRGMRHCAGADHERHVVP